MNKIRDVKPDQKIWRVLIVDDHPLLRRGVAEYLRQEPDLAVFGEAESAHQAMELMTHQQPDLAVVDLSLPDKGGLELIRDIRALHPKVIILVLSMHDEDLYAERALRLGARGYLMKDAVADNFMSAIRQVISGQIYVSEKISVKVLNAFAGKRTRAGETALSALTDREFEVLQLIGQGLTSREIARRLNMSVKTVETHRLHLKSKLELRTSPELIRYAIRWVASRHLI